MLLWPLLQDGDLMKEQCSTADQIMDQDAPYQPANIPSSLQEGRGSTQTSRAILLYLSLTWTDKYFDYREMNSLKGLATGKHRGNSRTLSFYQ